MKIVSTPIENVKPYDRNPRNHDVAAIVKSITEFGWRQPIVVDKKGVIVVGHGRYFAAKQMGLKKVPVHTATELTPAQIRAYRLVDNRVQELGSWDEEALLAEMEEMAGVDWSAFGFDTSLPPATLDNSNGAPPIVNPIFQVLIECKTEREQSLLLKRFVKEGLVAKAIIT